MLSFLLLTFFCFGADAQVYMPGTQPNEGGIELSETKRCKLCHSNRDSTRFMDPYGAWSTGTMSHAGQDPVFRAALTIANQDRPHSGNYCLRCHTPAAWLQGRAHKYDGSALTNDDERGVTCEICHRAVDPRSEEARKYAAVVPPGYGNAMLVLDPRFVVRGPYDHGQPGESDEVMPHETVQSNFQSSAELCGSCHDFSNPYLATDATTQPPHEYGPLGRTYSEWSSSAYAREDKPCQSCHYPKIRSGGQAARYADVHREYFIRMGAVGGGVWTKRAILHQWGRGFDKLALQEGMRRSRAFLRTAADLDLKVQGGVATLRVTNNAGHKLPTGYPEGTRLWLNMRFLDAEGGLIAERGTYGTREETINGETLQVPTLLDPDRTRVYEVHLGLSAAAAAKHGQKPGRTFHVILADKVLRDTRIPPRGFTNKALAARKAAPIGVRYADGQNWDEVKWPVPRGTQRVEARLYYQSLSFEYLRFLVETNTTDDTGTKLWETWKATDMAPPEDIAEAHVDLTP